MKQSAAIIVSFALLVSTVHGIRDNSPLPQVPTFIQDLRPLGFVVAKPGFVVYKATGLAFLSDDLLLVALNHQEYDESSVSSPSDASPATLLLFGVSEKKLIRTAQKQMGKSLGSVWAVLNEHFVILNDSGIQLCTSALDCGAALPTKGGLYVSPRGTKMAVGGHAWSKQRLLDAADLSIVRTYPGMTGVPGDRDFLACRQGRLTVNTPDGKDRELGITDECFEPTARFLSDERLIVLQRDEALVMTPAGTVLYKVRVKDVFRSTSFISSVSGSRFAINELAFTRLNSITNFMDLKVSRPRNFKRIRVFDTESGKTLFTSEWDPHRYGRDAGDDDLPALSPSGHRLALVRQGVLQVYEIP